MLNLPYNFVPLSRAILHPEWAPRVSHDHPFRDGLSGELSVRITAETPLCVGGSQTKPTETSPGTVHFFRTPENQLAIPGSSIKGMLRNVVKIASFGHFNTVDDVRLSVRDLTRSATFYRDAVKRPCAGWLVYGDGNWKIIPCQFGRVLQTEILNLININPKTWNLEKNRKAGKRYEMVGGILRLAFEKQDYKYEGAFDARNIRKLSKNEQASVSEGEGYLVMTGQPSEDFQKQGAKKRDFIFFAEDSTLVKSVRHSVMVDFMSIHSESTEWEFWQNKIKTNSVYPGIPVFYHEREHEISSIGLSMMYRLAYKNSLHDAIGNTSSAHLKNNALDLAQLLFGKIDGQDENGEYNLRGRVSVSTAKLDTSEGQSVTQETRCMVLSSPKPTFYPAYIDQTRRRSGDQLTTLMDSKVELSGWKRYPVRDEAEVPLMSDLVAGNPKVQVKLETVAPGTSFCAKIRYHNLLPAELGAVLWALDFGAKSEPKSDAKSNARHSLGTGKPFGFGQVKLEVDDVSLRPNLDPGSKPEDPGVLADACRDAFEELMQGFWKTARVDDDDSDWKQSPQLIQLLAMSDRAVGRERKWDYPTGPQPFMSAKQQGDVLERYFDPEQSRAGAEARQGEYSIEHPADFAKLIQDAKNTHQKVMEQKQRNEEKESMSGNDRLIADAEDFLSPEDWTKSAFTRLDKHLRSLLQISADDFDASQRDKLLEVGGEVHNIVVEHAKQGTSLDKAMKKLFKHLNAEPPQ